MHKNQSINKYFIKCKASYYNIYIYKFINLPFKASNIVGKARDFTFML